MMKPSCIPGSIAPSRSRTTTRTSSDFCGFCRMVTRCHWAYENEFLGRFLFCVDPGHHSLLLLVPRLLLLQSLRLLTLCVTLVSCDMKPFVCILFELNRVSS